MRRAIQFMLRLYPARWRERYRGEFEALLEQMRPGWRDVFDVLRSRSQLLPGIVLRPYFTCARPHLLEPDSSCL
jgi:hypothetical protein